MSRATKTLIEGAVTFAVGLALKLWGLDTQIWWVTPTKAGVVLMVIGGLLLASGLFQSVRRTEVTRK
ncbi:DUF5708 family protein [Streptomyces sp. NBC_00237]|uniref:DUF5708 family protein n=1 Tax=Streptomyces sp. NBC_00237 TaxID=2975687 RepID=UPI0022556CF2|nr:DUF5708 family protein [Streptomyces sp. NBC_00237]MCX5203308.1 DUF5708 family protein [Streptomyces sp. NBC_00237]